ncbi:hypothetical protein XELAEV_18038588mg [Xenopus laevis]|uniref:L1 transposable element RRM domain-containing protein n=1 Tax=Xenopus laevis TaxID=8355 RepID=A0A974C6F9_XENLA|nr:hypothetical protein XELAEV_18038588mg [Xenopus laevis]
MVEDDPQGLATASTGNTPDASALQSMLADLPNKADLAQLLKDIKSSIKQEVTGLQVELSKLSNKLTTLETAHTALQDKTGLLVTKITNQDRQIYLLRRAMKDSENRNRRCNIRIRGLPDDVERPEARQLMEDLFRQLLGLDKDKPVRIERFHKVTATFHDKIELYQDLAHSTILQRRFLKGVVDILKSRKIIYRWAYPFALVARHNGSWLQLREPSEASRFCSTLNIETPDLTEWSQYAYSQRAESTTERNELTVPSSIIWIT